MWKRTRVTGVDGSPRRSATNAEASSYPADLASTSVIDPGSTVDTSSTSIMPAIVR